MCHVHVQALFSCITSRITETIQNIHHFLTPNTRHVPLRLLMKRLLDFVPLFTYIQCSSNSDTKLFAFVLL